MNISQQIFLVFFAIFWGTTANAWPKRKPFHWPFVFHSRRVAVRALWSMLVLNVVPVFYFGWVLMKLGPAASHPVVWCDVIAGVVPAFAMFGFYRIWIAGVEISPSCFYYQNEVEQDREAPALKCLDPTVQGLHPRPDRWRFNLLFGAMYVAVAVIALLAATPSS